MEIPMTKNPTVVCCFRVELDGPIPQKLWRKLERPPEPWKRCQVETRQFASVRFTAYYKVTDPHPDLSWVEMYLLRMSLIQGKR